MVSSAIVTQQVEYKPGVSKGLLSLSLRRAFLRMKPIERNTEQRNEERQFTVRPLKYLDPAFPEAIYLDILII